MHFFSPSTIFLIAIAVAQFFAPPASADSCDNDCSTVVSKLWSCGGVPDFPALPELPRRGEVNFPEFPKLDDAALNNCLCSNETINAYRKLTVVSPCHTITPFFSFFTVLTSSGLGPKKKN